MDGIEKAIAAVLGAIVGVAIIAVIVSSKSNTAGVISSAASGFGSILSVAVSPVTGGSGSGLVSNTGAIGSLGTYGQTGSYVTGSPNNGFGIGNVGGLLQQTGTTQQGLLGGQGGYGSNSTVAQSYPYYTPATSGVYDASTGWTAVDPNGNAIALLSVNGDPVATGTTSGVVSS